MTRSRGQRLAFSVVLCWTRLHLHASITASACACSSQPSIPAKQVVIVDESHTLRTSDRPPDSRITEAAVATIRAAARAVLLSGTPSLSRPYDLFRQVPSYYIFARFEAPTCARAYNEHSPSDQPCTRQSNLNAVLCEALAKLIRHGQMTLPRVL